MGNLCTLQLRLEPSAPATPNYLVAGALQSIPRAMRALLRRSACAQPAANLFILSSLSAFLPEESLMGNLICAAWHGAIDRSARMARRLMPRQQQ